MRALRATNLSAHQQLRFSQSCVATVARPDFPWADPPREVAMLNTTTMLGAIAATLLAIVPGQAQTLAIVEVNAPKINCVFQTDCSVVVNDSTGQLALPFLATPGTAWLQSRTYP